MCFFLLFGVFSSLSFCFVAPMYSGMTTQCLLFHVPSWAVCMGAKARDSAKSLRLKAYTSTAKSPNLFSESELSYFIYRSPRRTTIAVLIASFWQDIPTHCSETSSPLSSQQALVPSSPPLSFSLTTLLVSPHACQRP